MAIGVNKEDKSLYMPFIDQLISISDFKDTDKELVISLEYLVDNQKIEEFYIEVETNRGNIYINNSSIPLSLSEELDKLIILYNMNNSSIGKYEYSESDPWGCWNRGSYESNNSMEYLNNYLFKLVEEYPNSKELILKNLPFHFPIKGFSFNTNGLLDVHLLDVSSNTIKDREFISISSGEKVIFLAAFLEVYTTFYPSILLWDTPDAHISIDEVEHLVMGLRRNSHSSDYQLIMSSNTIEGIRTFSSETTIVLYKTKTGTNCSLLKDLNTHNDLTSTLILGDLFYSEDFCKALD
jgi:hypothetical protein